MSSEVETQIGEILQKIIPDIETVAMLARGQSFVKDENIIRAVSEIQDDLDIVLEAFRLQP